MSPRENLQAAMYIHPFVMAFLGASVTACGADNVAFI